MSSQWMKLHLLQPNHKLAFRLWAWKKDESDFVWSKSIKA
jgi:hypothetical protein